MSLQCSSAVVASTRPTFDGLSMEIRLQIFQHLLQVEDLQLHKSNIYTIHPAILSVSKKINAEAAVVLYSMNIFAVDYLHLDTFQTSFLAEIGQTNRDLIREIAIRFSTSDLWITIGPDAGRGPVLRENVPQNLRQLAMVHKWSGIYGHPMGATRLDTELLGEEIVQLSVDLLVMANFLKMNISFMPSLSKMVMGPDRKVSLVEEGASVNKEEGQLRIRVEVGKWSMLRYTKSMKRLEGPSYLIFELVERYKEGDPLSNDRSGTSRGEKPFWMGDIRRL
ncbi:hypothetical protein MMC30_006770 [Trapelia coarctata]|nr:hypothetical protein [Trapelia coarctata]